MYQGIISKVSGFDYENKKLWSFQLQNDNTFYRTGEIRPKCQVQEFVTFEGTPGKKGSINVDTKSLQVKVVEQEATGVQLPAKSTGGSPKSSEEYWERKEGRDIFTQARIERQSCRNSALEFVKILLSQGAVKFAEKTKEAQRVETLEQLLGHYQEQFLKDNSGEKDEPTVTETKVSDEVPY